MIKSDIDTRLALLELEDTFAKSWDSGDAERHASLYTDNGILEMEAAGPLPANTIHGRKTLGDFCLKNSRNYPGLHMLDISSFDLRRRGNIATGSVKFEFCFFADDTSCDQNASNDELAMQPQDSLQHVTGIYHTTYIYSKKQWHIQRRSMSKIEQSDNGVYNIPSLG
jgi:hypothetical protein